MSNPFAILSVDRAATKRDILVQVAAALREGRHEARAIAEAQKVLFDFTTRGAAEFEHIFDACGGSGGVRPEPVGEDKGPRLKLLS